MVPISLRMKTIADMVPMGVSTADIGCDHGFVSIYLVTNREAGHVVAMDVNEGPLLRAKEHIRQYGLEDLIDTRLSDGAVGLKLNETDAAVIAGMGGRLTVKILDESLDKFKAMKCLVLSPHSDIPFVRNYLASKGFAIDDEEMVMDEGKYYVVIKCSYTGEQHELSILQSEYGPKLIAKKHPVLKDYLSEEVVKMTEILERLSEEKVQADDSRSEAIEHRIDELKSIVQNIGTVLEGM